MALKIRLARRGRLDHALYAVVVADARAPRDGRFIEKVGTYNPQTDPARVNLKAEPILGWLSKGAQPTHTVRTLLSKAGILYKRHLQLGVTRGKITEETAKERFVAWEAAKSAKAQPPKKQTKADSKASQKMQAQQTKAMPKKSSSETKAPATPDHKDAGQPSAQKLQDAQDQATS